MLDPRSRDVELCSFYVTPEKETGTTLHRPLLARVLMTPLSPWLP